MREVRQNNKCRKCGERKYSCECDCDNNFSCLFDGDEIVKEAALLLSKPKEEILPLERIKVKWLMEKYYTLGYWDGEV